MRRWQSQAPGPAGPGSAREPTRSELGCPRVVAVNKPRGVLVSTVPERGAKTVFSFLPPSFSAFHPVGRLDKDSEGLLLLCEDAKLAQRLMDPGVLAKTYLVIVRGLPSEQTLQALRAGGLELDGRRTRPAEVRVLGKAPRGGTGLLVVLHEGINRQIRRLFHRFGHRVRRLVRVAVGPVGLGELAPGQWRELAEEEVRQLLHAAKLPAEEKGAATRPSQGLRIISGGQTGVDRAALDTALALGLPCGGFCPRGRRAEDGPIPERYPLVEMASTAYAARTWANVRQADATLVLSPLPLRGGTLLAVRACQRLGKPFLVVDPRGKRQVDRVYRWLRRSTVRVLNVAGPRESQQPGIYTSARAFLLELLTLWPKGSSPILRRTQAKSKAKRENS